MVYNPTELKLMVACASYYADAPVKDHPLGLRKTCRKAEERLSQPNSFERGLYPSCRRSKDLLTRSPFLHP